MAEQDATQQAQQRAGEIHRVVEPRMDQMNGALQRSISWLQADLEMTREELRQAKVKIAELEAVKPTKGTKK